MIQIRNSMFETNSSSMHSLVLLKNADKVGTLEEAMQQDDRMIVKNGAVIIEKREDLEFGWGFEILDSFYGRLRYAIASFVPYCYDGENSLDMILRSVQELFPEITEIHLPKSEYEDEEDYAFEGSIDHNSMGTLQGFLSEKNMTLSEYLADNHVLVLIDNDNSMHFESILMSGIIDREKLCLQHEYDDEEQEA